MVTVFPSPTMSATANITSSIRDATKFKYKVLSTAAMWTLQVIDSYYSLNWIHYPTYTCVTSFIYNATVVVKVALLIKM